MEVNDIIILENDQRYTLLEQTTKDNDKYFLAASVNENEDIDIKQLALLKVIRENDEDYVELVQNEQLIRELTSKITSAKN